MYARGEELVKATAVSFLMLPTSKLKTSTTCIFLFSPLTFRAPRSSARSLTASQSVRPPKPAPPNSPPTSRTLDAARLFPASLRSSQHRGHRGYHSTSPSNEQPSFHPSIHHGRSSTYLRQDQPRSDRLPVLRHCKSRFRVHRIPGIYFAAAAVRTERGTEVTGASGR